MGANSSGARRKQKQRRTRKDLARLEKKAAAGAKPAASPATQSGKN